MDEQLQAEIKDMFQKGYALLYKDGHFDTIREDAEDGGDVAVAVSRFLATIIGKLITEGGVTSPEVLFTVGSLLTIDIVNALAESGVDASEEDITESINQTMVAVLKDNPEFASMIMKDPAVAELMQGLTSGGGEGGVSAPEEAGVMGGIE